MACKWTKGRKRRGFQPRLNEVPHNLKERKGTDHRKRKANSKMFGKLIEEKKSR